VEVFFVQTKAFKESNMQLHTWLAFLAASWIISLSPGAGAIASMSCGLRYGFWRGYWNALGLQLGLLLQIIVVAAGVGAVLTASATAFQAIKWFGVGYLLYLAIKQWRSAPVELQDSSAGQPMATPLSLVIMLAVLPQFINPHAPLASQYATIAITMVCVDLLVMAGYTGLAARVLRLLRAPSQQRRMNRTFAALFVGAATFLATLRPATV
jgi:homoserine/homoserine lactone efflux protein